VTYRLDRRGRLFREDLDRRIAHASRPDVETTSNRGLHLPHAPDALALVEPRIADVVLADVMLDPAAPTVVDVILASQRKHAYDVASVTMHAAAAKCQPQLHPMAQGLRLQIEALPRSGREAAIVLERRLGLGH